LGDLGFHAQGIAMSDERIQQEATNVLASSAPASAPSEEWHVFCPHCFRPTESLKAYNIGKVIFLLAAFFWDYDTVVACPSCMRKALTMRALMAIPLSNILFPIAAIFYLGQYIATFAPGHSDLLIAGQNRRRLEDRFVGVEHMVQLWSWSDLKPPVSRGFVLVMAVIGLFVFLIFALLGFGNLYAWLTEQR
jgi:hypothetical protein